MNDTRYAVTPRTLVFLTHGDEVLLIERSLTSRLFPGLFNGVGGHVERGEDIVESARREVREETGIEVDELVFRGILHADEGADCPGAIIFVFVSSVAGKGVRSTTEGQLHWVPLAELDRLAVVPDLLTLLPLLIDSDAGDGIFFISQTTAPIHPG